MKWLVNFIKGEKNRNKTEVKETLGKKEQALYRVGREQFVKLKEKGISIPIFTL